MKNVVLPIVLLTSLSLVAVDSRDYSFLPEGTVSAARESKSVKEDALSEKQDNGVLPAVIVVDDEIHSNDYQEYEQHVCDNAHTPKVSSTTAYLREVGCSLLIRYLALKEQAGKYLTSVKNSVGKMLGLIA